MLLDKIKAPMTAAFDTIEHHHAANPTFIPVHLTGGIGDVVMAIDAIKFLATQYQIVVYTHHIEAFRYFCKDNIPSFKVLPEFTWQLEFNTIAKFHFRHGFHGFAVKEHEDLFLKQEALFRDDPRLETLVKTHFDKFFLIARYAEEMKLNRRDFPLYCLGYKSKVPFEIIAKYPRVKLVTIHDGFDIHNRHIVSGRATKQWKWDHWNTLVRKIKTRYPGYSIMQLGTSSTAREIDGAISLIDKTSIVEAFKTLSAVALHIDGDSGLVHAATKMNIPCVTMWGPTPHKFYGYPQNKNVTSSICSGSCYGVKENWNDKCVVGYSSPRCMDEITPEMVMKEVINVLG